MSNTLLGGIVFSLKSNASLIFKQWQLPLKSRLAISCA
jgi:hypothetical protein